MSKRTGTIIVTVEYDDEETSLESLSSMLDTLIENPRPDMLEGEGNPVFSNFWAQEVQVRNLAPDVDAAQISSGSACVSIGRLEGGEVEVHIEDTNDGSHRKVVLGEWRNDHDC